MKQLLSNIKRIEMNVNIQFWKNLILNVLFYVEISNF